jgi:hypothetical protein
VHGICDGSSRRAKNALHRQPKSRLMATRFGSIAIFESSATISADGQRIGTRWWTAFHVLAVGLHREEEMQLILSTLRRAWHSALLRIDKARLRRQGRQLGQVDRRG